MSLVDQSQQWYPTSVKVTVFQAKNLRIKGKHGTNDAYAIMQVAKEKVSTSVAEKSVSPVWKEEASFDLPLFHHGNEERCTLRVSVMHRALVGMDKQLGQVAVNLLDLNENQNRNKTEWFKLLDKHGKADKERGEVLLDIQFMRNNMTASMFDLSGQGKSRSRMGKLKDKIRGKKAGLSDSASAIVPSSSSSAQVMTDSEDEAEGVEGDKKKKKKNKLKSLFGPKSNLQRNISQSMVTLGSLSEKNSALSGSRSSGLNVDSPEGKKKFKFLTHKRTGSSDSKSSHDSLSVLGRSKLGGPEQSGVCINGSHVYVETPLENSTLSLNSSDQGSVEDLQWGRGRSEFPSHEEEEESREEQETKRLKEEQERKREEQEKREEEERRKREEEEETRKREEEEEMRKMEVEEMRKREEEEEMKREMKRREVEEMRKREEEEEMRREMRKREVEEMRKREEEEEMRREMKRREEEEMRKREEEQEMRKREVEEMRKREEEEEMRKREVEEMRKREEEEEMRKREEEEVMRREMKRREEEEMRKREEEQEMGKREEIEEMRREEEEVRKREQVLEKNRLEEARKTEQLRNQEEKEAEFELFTEASSRPFTETSSNPFTETSSNPFQESSLNASASQVIRSARISAVRPRPHAVKPLSSLESQYLGADLGQTWSSPGADLGGTEGMTKVMESMEGEDGPYSQLTRSELSSLVLKQQEQLSEKDSKITELEEYIDNLLVRIIEEQPNLLQSINTIKKSV
ncbi:hypothetical protein COCON_G00164520 [Conger conger]|uniref:Rab11 family-interacting protein 1-like n=1 Tax=Conger conger TaxID=82655 RepID=A0A9Q1D7F1_CONCO|nr:hypothetical protein COCON_G00164520 [Conger conger]